MFICYKKDFFFVLILNFMLLFKKKMKLTNKIIITLAYTDIRFKENI